MAFPTTSMLDDFNRADESTLGGNWSTITGLGMALVSNHAQGRSSANGRSYWNVETMGPDCEVWADAAISFGDSVVLLARVGSIGASWTGYGVGLIYNFSPVTHELRLIRFDSGSDVTLATTTVAQANLDRIGISCNDDEITAWVEHSLTWSSPLTVTDATYGAAGYIGMQAFDTGAIDGFGGGTVFIPDPFPRASFDAARVTQRSTVGVR